MKPRPSSKLFSIPELDAGTNEKLALIVNAARSGGVVGTLLIVIPIGVWAHYGCLFPLQSSIDIVALSIIVVVGAAFGLAAGLGIGTVIGSVVALLSCRKALSGYERHLTALLSVSLVGACFAEGILAAHERFRRNCPAPAFVEFDTGVRSGKLNKCPFPENNVRFWNVNQRSSVAAKTCQIGESLHPFHSSAL